MLTQASFRQLALAPYFLCTSRSLVLVYSRLNEFPDYLNLLRAMHAPASSSTTELVLCCLFVTMLCPYRLDIRRPHTVVQTSKGYANFACVASDLTATAYVCRCGHLSHFLELTRWISQLSTSPSFSVEVGRLLSEILPNSLKMGTSRYELRRK